MTGKNRMQAMMYIKDFSTRQVDIVVEPLTPTPTSVATAVETTTAATTPKTPGFVITLGAIGTIAAAYIMRRRG
jgi:predicted S18 family serine protease